MALLPPHDPPPDSSSRTSEEAAVARRPRSEVACANISAEWSPDSPLVAHRSTMSEIWLCFRRDKFALVGLVTIVILVIVAVFAPWLAPHNPTTQFDQGLTSKGMPVGPSAKFVLGTDTLGRDLLSRIMFGARASLIVGILANGFALLLGVVFGLTAGYFRGWVESVIMRATDVMMAFPILPARHRPVGRDQQGRASGCWCWSSASCTGRR